MPLALNVTGAGGVPVVDQVYVRLVSASDDDAPSTESDVLVPATGAGLAAAGVTTVGGALKVTLANVALVSCEL